MRNFLERQRAFMEKFHRDEGLPLAELRRDPAALVHWLKEYTFHLEGELHEFVGEFSWKMHAHPAAASPLVRSNAREEWIDSFKYLMALAVIMDYTPAELAEAFEQKSAVVELKYEQERRLAAIPASSPVVAVDVDGVLTPYPDGFRDWLIARGAASPGDLLRPGGELGKALKEVRTDRALRKLIGIEHYENLKHLYRDSGAKAQLTPRGGARALLSALRAAGATVVALSARPAKRYSRIWSDTLMWMESRGLHHDGILFDEKKHLQILKRFPRLLALVEDNPSQATAVAEQGHRVYLLRTPDNEHWTPPPELPVTVCEDLIEVREKLLTLLEDGGSC